MFFGLTWNLGPPSSMFAMITFGPGQVEAAVLRDVAEHEIEHARHQQRHAEHKDDRERAAEGTGQIFEGNVEWLSWLSP